MDRNPGKHDMTWKALLASAHMCLAGYGPGDAVHV